MTARKKPEELKHPGRPLVGAEPMDQRLHVVFTQSEVDALKQAATTLDVSVGEAIRRAVRAAYLPCSARATESRS